MARGHVQQSCSHAVMAANPDAAGINQPGKLIIYLQRHCVTLSHSHHLQSIFHSFCRQTSIFSPGKRHHHHVNAVLAKLFESLTPQPDLAPFPVGLPSAAVSGFVGAPSASDILKCLRLPAFSGFSDFHRCESVPWPPNRNVQQKAGAQPS